MNRIRSFLKDLFKPENIITLIGIIVAVVLAYSGIKNNNTAQTLNGIVTVLAALATAQLISGFSAPKTKKSIEHIEHLLQEPYTSFMTRGQLDTISPFERLLERGQDILIVGTSLLGTVGPRRKFFKALAQNGASLRFLLMDPEASFIEAAACSHGVSIDSLRNDISATLSHLNSLVGSVGNGGSIQYRLLTTMPNMSFVMVDGNKTNGEIRCELYLYQTDITERPVFRLTPADETVYQRYKDSLERLWRDSINPERRD